MAKTRSVFASMIASFSSTWKKTKQKKTPVSRLTLRVATAAGARGNSPACGGVRQSARFNPSVAPMLGAEQREIQNQSLKKPF